MGVRLRVGLLWYDGDPKRDLTHKVERAAARYREKYGRAANACYVHQGSLEGELDWCGVRIVGAQNILPNHFWVGVVESGHQATPQKAP